MITTRTHLAVCAALAAALAGPAMATNTGCKGDPHKCTPTTPATPSTPSSSTSTSQAGSASTSASTSSASAGAAAGAQASGVGTASIGDVGASVGPVSVTTGSVSTSTGPAYGGNASADGTQSVSDSSRSNYYAFPAPVAAAPLPPTNCPKGDSMAWSIGWNFFSYSRSSTRTELECLDRWLEFVKASTPVRTEARLPSLQPGEPLHPPISVSVTVEQPAAVVAPAPRKAAPKRKAATCPTGTQAVCKRA
jgi:hypothetical protein